MRVAGAENSKVAILTYHSIDKSGSVVSISPETFRKQMQYLSESSFNVVSLSEILAAFRDRRLLPAKTVVITFDDGYKNVYTEAFPVLNSYGFTATTFLITNYCGKHNNWPGQLPSLERRPLLSWSEIEEMRKHGFEFGAHTRTHPDLTQIPIEQAAREITESKLEIQDRLGVETETFAYPYGKFDSKVKEIVRRQFHGACSTNLGTVVIGDDLSLMKRIDMYYLSNHKLFSKLQTRSLARYLTVRQSLRKLKGFFSKTEKQYIMGV